MYHGFILLEMHYKLVRCQSLHAGRQSAVNLLPATNALNTEAEKNLACSAEQIHQLMEPFFLSKKQGKASLQILAS